MSDLLIESIGWALVQFVWQGALVGAVVAVTLLVIRQSAAARYVVAAVGLAAMLVTAVGTTMWYARALRHEVDGATFATAAVRVTAGAAVGPTLRSGVTDVVRVTSSRSATAPGDAFDTPAQIGPSFSASVTNWSTRIGHWLPAAVCVWLVGVLGLSLNLLRGWLRAERIRRRATETARDVLRMRVEALVKRLRLSGPVRVCESALVEVPAVVGWLRPVLLLPAATLTGLSPAQLDAVLAHELAHIRRHDYLVNMLQSGVETLLFFHPAVWWLSHRIRVERENCCDDVAVEVCADPLEYARALVSLEEGRLASRSFALAATDGSLLARIRRVLEPTPSQRSGPTWIAGMAGGLLVTSLVGLSAAVSAPWALPTVVRSVHAGITGPLLVPPSIDDGWPQAQITATQPVRNGSTIRGRATLEAGWGQAVPQAPPQASTSRSGVIRGRVVAADTGLPLRRAQLRLTGPGLTPPPETATDDEGRYEIVELPAGRFALSVRKTGFVSDPPRRGEPGRQIDVAPGQRVEAIDFRLPKGSTITVRVLDDLGDPIAGARVHLERITYIQGRRQMAMAPADAPSSEADDLGLARLSGVPPGDYYVRVNPYMDNVRNQLLGANDSNQIFAVSYFPGTTVLSEAHRVRIGVGQELALSVPLQVAKKVRISGIVRDSSGAPATGSMGVIRMLDGSGSRSVPLQPDGSFTVSDLVAGEYMFTASGPPPVEPNVPRETLNVPTTIAEDTTGLVFTTSSGALIRGRMIFEGGEPPTDTRSGVPSVTVANAGEALSPRIKMQATVRPDWTFEMRAAGRGLVRAGSMTPPSTVVTLGAPAGWYLKAVRHENRDITDTALDFDSAREFNDLEVVFTQRRASVAGSVTDARKAPTVSYAVVLFPEDRTLWIPRSRFIAAGRPDAQGRFRIPGMPPGRYLVATVPSLDTGEENDPGLLTRLEDRATRLILADGDVHNVILRLEP